MNLDKAFLKIISELKKRGVNVEFYKAISSNSYYLRLDYGLLGTVRISDHEGKRMYYNNYVMRSDIEEYYVSGGIDDVYHYPLSEEGVLALVNDILNDREEKEEDYGSMSYYRNKVNLLRKENNSNREEEGYWKDCELMIS